MVELTEWELADQRRRIAWRKARLEGSCKCGRTVHAHIPKGGNGDAYITFWHKNPEGEWCRSEIDLADIREIGQSA